jgi:hypothetical protein
MGPLSLSLSLSLSRKKETRNKKEFGGDKERRIWGGWAAFGKRKVSIFFFFFLFFFLLWSKILFLSKSAG